MNKTFAMFVQIPKGINESWLENVLQCHDTNNNGTQNTKHKHKTQKKPEDRAIRTVQKIWVDCRCSGRLRISCSTFSYFVEIPKEYRAVISLFRIYPLVRIMLVYVEFLIECQFMYKAVHHCFIGRKKWFFHG